MSVKAQFLTHEVGNQPQPLPPCNLWRVDTPLQEAVARHALGSFDSFVDKP